MLELTAPATSHILRIFRALVNSGWRLRSAPADGRLLRNGQRVILRFGKGELKVRIFTYKVTGSGRAKPYERRIEITSTYKKGVTRAREYQDIVVGIDLDHDLFVGVDPRRIGHGGPTGNASSFFDISGLSWKGADEILVQPRAARLFSGGIEFHAFIRPVRLAEYMFNLHAIHAGTYSGCGPFSGRQQQVRGALLTDEARDDVVILHGPRPTKKKRPARNRIVEAYESGAANVLLRKKISPERFLDIRLQMEENGSLGEEFALNHERRVLRRAGRSDLADRVKWVSRESVCEGYDILSYDLAGHEKWIEVKSTSGASRTFEMSDLEWRTCCAAGEKYYIYRITTVRTSPSIEKVRNPHRLWRKGRITKAASGWRVTLL